MSHFRDYIVGFYTCIDTYVRFYVRFPYALAECAARHEFIRIYVDSVQQYERFGMGVEPKTPDISVVRNITHHNVQF